MASVVKNKTQFLKVLNDAGPKLDDCFREKMRYAVSLVHFAVVERTPVWSGAAIANYQWSVGAPQTINIAFIDNGDPGHTNLMPLGSEPRRGPNEEIATASLERLSFENPYQFYILNNNDPDIMDLEYGALPSPGRSRSKAMVANAMSLAAYYFEVGGI